MKYLITFLLIFFSSSSNAKELKSFELSIHGKKTSFNLAAKAKNYNKVVINFWASWCTACIQELDELEALKDKYEKKGVLFIAINAGEKRKKIKRFLKRYKFSYLILEDHDRKVSKLLGVKELPRTIVIDKNLKILFNSNRPPKDL